MISGSIKIWSTPLFNSWPPHGSIIHVALSSYISIQRITFVSVRSPNHALPPHPRIADCFWTTVTRIQLCSNAPDVNNSWWRWMFLAVTHPPIATIFRVRVQCQTPPPPPPPPPQGQEYQGISFYTRTRINLSNPLISRRTGGGVLTLIGALERGNPSKLMHFLGDDVILSTLLNAGLCKAPAAPSIRAMLRFCCKANGSQQVKVDLLI